MVLICAYLLYSIRQRAVVKVAKLVKLAQFAISSRRACGNPFPDLTRCHADDKPCHQKTDGAGLQDFLHDFSWRMLHV